MRMQDAKIARHYKPPGPVAAAFLNDTTSRVKLIRGPVGGGKTVTCIFDLLKQAQAMPVCRDGEIHFRVAVIGTTYGQLERNLYPTWHFWLPREGWNDNGDFHGGGGRFATHKLRWMTVRDGKRVWINFEAVFAAIGELSVEQFVRGFEPTAWYLYEVDQLPDGIIEQAIGRLGRYPNAEMMMPGATYRPCVVCDLNAPDIDSWYYRLVEEARPPGLVQYVQPSGLSARAENTQNLPAGYYQSLQAANAHKPKWVKRFILNEYGPSDDGQPVYPEYADDVHLSRVEILVDRTLPLYIGFDQGLTMPAAIIGQRKRTGQWVINAEFVPGRMNGRRFGAGVRALLEEIAPGVPIASAFADPAGFIGADREANELCWAEVVGLELRIAIQPAPTNEVDPRLTAVKDELTFMIDGSTPGLVISGPRCPMLRKGFASHYRYARQRVGNTERYSTKPEKNDWSNPHDALQYLLLGVKGRYGVISGKRNVGQLPAGGSLKLKSSFISSEGW